MSRETSINHIWTDDIQIEEPVIKDPVELPDVLKIQVTRKELKRNYGCAFTCPLAAAIMKHFKGKCHTLVDQNTVQIWDRRATGFFATQYKLSAKDNCRLKRRGGNSLWGKIAGRFTVTLIKRQSSSLPVTSIRLRLPAHTSSGSL